MRRLSAGLVILTLAVVPQVPANAATRTVCTGVNGCKVVASADIDGDGKPTRWERRPVAPRRSAAGASTLQWRIVTYRKGKLVLLKPPPGTWIVRPSRWTTDGSATTHIGWSRKVSSKGKISLVRKTAVGEPGRGGTGRTTTYLWRSEGWVKTSSVKKKYSSFKSATAIEGWHIKGLRSWPQH